MKPGETRPFQRQSRRVASFTCHTTRWSCPPSFIRQVDDQHHRTEYVCSRPEDGLGCRLSIKPPLKLVQLQGYYLKVCQCQFMEFQGRGE